ncbi:hypothetical protein OAG63_00565 [Methylacidiphilales bacterium]|nr:hypothetical protein [Candidatus Methylacidiphilales bacterium]
MNKPFHAVEMSRHWRDQVSRDVAGMSQREKIAHFQQFNSVAALKAKPVPTKALPVVTPTPRKKGFNAVVESRKWRVATGRKLNAMSRTERLTYLKKTGKRVRAELRARHPVAA